MNVENIMEQHKSNKEIFGMMKTSLKLMKIIKKRKCEYFGHIIRSPNSIQRLLLGTRIDRKRGKGRPRTIWMDSIKDWLNLSYKECIRNTENREKWRSITFNLREQRKPYDDDDEWKCITLTGIFSVMPPEIYYLMVMELNSITGIMLCHFDVKM